MEKSWGSSRGSILDQMGSQQSDGDLDNLTKLNNGIQWQTASAGTQGQPPPHQISCQEFTRNNPQKSLYDTMLSKERLLFLVIFTLFYFPGYNAIKLKPGEIEMVFEPL